MSANLSDLLSTIRRLKDDVTDLSRIAESVELARAAAGDSEPPGVDLPTEVKVPRPSAVAAYLSVHPDLAPILSDMAGALVREFQPEPSEIELAVYQDPEIDDEYLTFYVRVLHYDDTLMSRLRAVAEPFDDRLAHASDIVLITTDHRSVR
ncbi:MAG: hypothetical protein U0893_17755 [Chloroflexota bacterium]|mgnify:CR=1 FL=1